jgi:hypothetical protein
MARQPPAKRFQVGSTPTGVSLEARYGWPNGARRTVLLPRLSATCVPNMGFDECRVTARLAQWQSTRPRIWLSRVRLPYHHRRLNTCSNAARGRRANERSATGAACRRFVRHALCAGGSTSECHVVRGYRFRGPSAKLQWMFGDLRRGKPRQRRAERKLPCGRSPRGCSNDTPHWCV